jgi:hypothetical protein
MINRTLLLLLLGMFSLSSRADDTPAPCEAEWQRAIPGKPGYEEAIEAWRECKARADEAKKKEFAETGRAWALGLDPIPTGGWALLQVSGDGTAAVFGSRRHETRKGSVVSIWLRYEERESQTNNGATFKSEVERTLYDCERIATKAISATYYSENNLSGTGPSYVYDEAKTSWSPVIPGTVGDSLLEWACRTTTQPAKPR